MIFRYKVGGGGSRGGDGGSFSAQHDIYLVDYKLLNKCSSEAWDKLLKESKENNNIVGDESFESNESIGEEELKFIQENNKEYI